MIALVCLLLGFYSCHCLKKKERKSISKGTDQFLKIRDVTSQGCQLSCNWILLPITLFLLYPTKNIESPVSQNVIHVHKYHNKLQLNICLLHFYYIYSTCKRETEKSRKSVLRTKLFNIGPISWGATLIMVLYTCATREMRKKGLFLRLNVIRANRV